MKIKVNAKTGAKEREIVKLGVDSYKVSVKERPEKGRANEAIAEVIAEHFGISSQRVQIISGFSSPRKVFEVL